AGSGVGGIREHRDDDGRRSGDVGRRARGGGAVFGDLVRGGAAAVVHYQAVSRLDQVLRHGFAHDPKPYESTRFSHFARFLCNGGLTPFSKFTGLGADVGSDPVSEGYNPTEVL